LNRECEIVQKLFILKFEPDLDPEPEKLSEHGARVLGPRLYTQESWSWLVALDKLEHV